MRLCKCAQLTYSDNMRHPVSVLNPKETCNQRCPVFPNRSPGRQPSISHDCKVAGSTFLKFQRRLRIAHQIWIRRSHMWILVSATNLRSLYLVQHSPSVFFLSLSLSFSPQVSERLDQDEAPSPSQADKWYTCERWLLQLACRSLCIPSYRRCYLSTGKYHSNNRAGLPHRCGRRELRLRNFEPPRTFLVPPKKDRETQLSTGECKRELCT